MYGWFLSQKAVHLKWLRDSAITVIAHRMTRIEEARLACNDDRAVARKNLHFPIGRTWVYGPDFEDMELQQEWYGIAEDQDDEDEEWDDDLEIKLEDDDDPLNDIHPKVRQVVDEEDVAALRRLPYEEYRKSPHWQRQRRGALEHAGHRCQVCNVDELPLEVHHRTYERLGREVPDDLFVLCEICHGIFSKHGRLAKKTSFPNDQKKLPDDLQRALDICKEKGIKGPRALHREMGGTYYDAQKLFTELVERGLVERAKEG